MAAKWKLITKEELETKISKNNTYTDLMKSLGYSGVGGSVKYTIDSIKKKYPEIDFSHYKGQKWALGETIATNSKIYSKKRNMSLRILTYEQVFCDNSKADNKTVKRRLIADKMIEHKCIFCGNEGVWNEKPITLELDHINGVNNDHRIKNLRFLCPNCHSQTNTYKGRNIK